MRTLYRAACLWILGAQPALAQFPVFHTQDARTTGIGKAEFGIGLEYLAKHDAPAPDLHDAEYRLLIAGFHYGVADNVNFDVDWRGMLFGRLPNGVTDFDWGDVSISTRIQLVREEGARPAIGVRSSVKLPNTRYLPYRLGSNETDVAFQLLAARTYGSADLRANLGFSILGDPINKSSQDDLYTASIAGLFTLTPGISVFAECYGFSGYQKNDDKLVFRAGLIQRWYGFCWNLFGSLRALGNNKDFGTAFEGSENWSLGFVITKEIAIDL